MEKVINRTDIVENIISRQDALATPIITSKYDEKLFRVIVSMYIEFMIAAVLRGIHWELPKNFGTIKIVEKSYDSENVIPFRKPGSKETGRVYNRLRPGFVYQMVIESNLMDKMKCKFKATRKIRDKMHEMFTSKDTMI